MCGARVVNVVCILVGNVVGVGTIVYVRVVIYVCVRLVDTCRKLRAAPAENQDKILFEHKSNLGTTILHSWGERRQGRQGHKR